MREGSSSHTSPPRVPFDSPLGERGHQRRRCFGGRRDRPGKVDHQRDLAVVAKPPLHEVVVQQQRRLARSRRALERRREDPDDDPAAAEVRQHVARREGALLRVELVAALRAARVSPRDPGPPRARPPSRRPRTVRRRSPRAWRPDRSTGRSPGRTRTPGLTMSRYGCRTARGNGSSEHDVELRETEHERVALIDQHDLDVAPELLRQPGRQLQTTEPGAENQNSHQATLSRRARTFD